MVRAYVGMGSNIDPEANIRSGVAALRKLFHDLETSPVYRSKAIGFVGDDFYNLVAAFNTDLSAQGLASKLRDIEIAHGRAHSDKRFVPRALDLDLLLYGDLVIDSGTLKLPRPEILRHAYVLKPLADIASDRYHPQLKRRFRELWSGLDEPNSDLRPVSIDL